MSVGYFLSVSLFGLMAIFPTVFGHPLVGVLIFLIAVGLVTRQSFKQPVIYFGSTHRQTEAPMDETLNVPPTTLPVKPSPVTEAIEQRLERPDGSTLQIRRVRQWH